MGFIYSQLFITPTYPTRSFTGEYCIVTGANTGLGKEAARHLVRLGAKKVIIACRNAKAGAEAREDILNSTKADPSVVEVWNLDLSSYQSVKEFADRASKLPRIDVLLENAGIATSNFKLFEEHESTVTVNVISTFLLALLLLPKLKATAREFNINPRLTIVSSEVHGWSKFPEQDSENIFAALDNPQSSTMDERYPTSKLLEVLVVRQIAPQLRDSGVLLNMLNPGLCRTSLSREAKFPQSFVFAIMQAVLGRTIEVGSRTLLASASAENDSHGEYMSDSRIADDMVSDFVKGDKGRKVGAQVWNELRIILEKIEPGITSNL